MASDPRLIALYDDDNPDGPDHDHARALAEELGARTIVDLGCGTGQLAVSLARPGRTVIGVDPDFTAMEFARRRPGGEGVIWTDGDSTVMGDLAADLIVLTGNSVQHIGNRTGREPCAISPGPCARAGCCCSTVATPPTGPGTAGRADRKSVV